MKLSDIMGNAGLSGWAQVALVIFLAAFVAIVVHTYARKRKAMFEAAGQLPLDEDLGWAQAGREQHRHNDRVDAQIQKRPEDGGHPSNAGAEV